MCTRFAICDKHAIVLPAFMLAINSVCYGMILDSNIKMQTETPAKMYQQKLHKKLPQYRTMCDGDHHKNPSTSSG